MKTRVENVLIKPKKLRRGDRVATVSPSWGGAGDPELRWRYEQGVKRLEEVFGLKVIPMPNSLRGGRISLSKSASSCRRFDDGI